MLTAAVSADGDSVAISTFDPPTVQIRDIATGGSRTLAVPAEVIALGFSPDGSLLVAGDNDGQVLRIDPVTATLIGEPVIGHDGPIRSVSFAADGSRFTSGSTDGNVGMWETATGRNVGTIQPGSPNTEVHTTWAPDGHTLLAMYEDLSVYAFDTRPSSWFDHACRTAGRQLSQTEWTQLLPDRSYQPACR